MPVNRSESSGVPEPVQHFEDPRLADQHMAAGWDLVAYADGTATLDVQRDVEEHLDGCAPCTQAVAELRSLLLLMDLAQIGDDTVADDTSHG